jgi:N1-aminopropylagmatine ureohydrolase
MFLSSNFLGIPEEESTFEKSRVAVLPVPYERTVSYGVGTKNGPAAIIEASHYVELYDDELDEEPHRIGVHTLPPWIPENMEPAECVAELERVVAGLVAKGKFVLTLGGEHSIASGLIAAHRGVYPNLSVLHFDAHGDLRDVYEGQKFSHACAARRWLDLDLPTVQVGIRSISREEVEFVRSRKDIRVVSNREMHRSDDWMKDAFELLKEDVYVTFDVDFFDGALVPGTGTPEPGGGTYDQALRILRTLVLSRRIVGADVVEHSPLPGNRAPDFMIAKLCYKLLAYAHFPEKARRPVLSPE